MDPDGLQPMESLARGIAAGEAQAFLDFATAFYRSFYRYFLAHGIPDHEAGDLTANCMADIPLKIGKYQEQGANSFRAWVMTLRRNAAIDWWRRRKAEFTPLPDDLAEPPKSAAEMDAAVVQAVQDAVARLNAAHREIIELHDLGEIRTYKEIAALLTGGEQSVSEPAARVRHHRALKALRVLLEADPRITEWLKRRSVVVSERN